jgi:uncharacterized protein YceK
MKKRIIAAVLAVLVLSGCSPISSGYITEKTYEPAYTYITYDCKSYYQDDDGIRYCRYYGPTTHYVPDRWQFDLIQYRDGEDPVTGWVPVDGTVYDQYEVGDWYGERR